MPARSSTCTVESATAPSAGTLRVMRGESVLAEGSWSMERQFPSDLAADEIRARVRRALRFPGALAAGYTVEQAPAESSTAPAVPAWAARIGPRGELAIREEGALTLHFDGGRVLRTSDPFGWMPADARMQDKLLLAEVVRSGAWLAEASPLRFAAHVIGVGDRRRYVLEITTAAGVVPASVVLDPATWRPSGPRRRGTPATAPSVSPTPSKWRAACSRGRSPPPTAATRRTGGPRVSYPEAIPSNHPPLAARSSIPQLPRIWPARAAPTRTVTCSSGRPWPAVTWAGSTSIPARRS